MSKMSLSGVADKVAHSYRQYILLSVTNPTYQGSTQYGSVSAARFRVLPVVTVAEVAKDSVNKGHSQTRL